MKRIFKSTLAALVLLLSSCAEEDTVAKLSASDKAILEKLDQITSNAIELYPNYRQVIQIPSFLVLNEGTSRTGLLINPSDPTPAGSVKTDFQLLSEISVYRNNSLISELDGQVPDPAFFTDRFSTGSGSIFALKQKSGEFFNFYDNFKNVGGNWVHLAFIHELFHMYQLENWTLPPNGIQAFNDFPLQEDIIAHQLLLWDLADKAYLSTPGSNLTKQIAAVLSKLQELDPTPNGVIENHSGFQMWLEGSARYIEHFAAKESIYPSISNDPSHGWEDVVDNLEDGQLVRHIFAIRIWYHVGAGIINILSKSDNLVLSKLESGLTPFELVVSAADLTTTERDNLLQSIYSELNINQYKERAKYIVGLL